MRLFIAIVFVVTGSVFVASGNGVPIVMVFFPLAIAWAFATYITDAFTHKYPQRYYSYLLASRFKAAAVLGVTLVVFRLFAPSEEIAESTFHAAILVVVGDFLVSIPRRRMGEKTDVKAPLGRSVSQVVGLPAPLPPVNTPRISRFLRESADSGGLEDPAALIGQYMQGSDQGPDSVCLIDGDVAGATEQPEQVALLMQKKSLNTVKRLNLFLEGLPRIVMMGGYFAFRYRPMEEELAEIRSENRGLRLWLSYGWHFLRHRALPKIPILEKIYFSRYFQTVDEWVYERTKERRRVISRAEMWGRVYYWGFEVLGENRIGDDHWVVTRRVSDPETKRKPSFFLVARLTKVGLDGKPLHVHKLRTMYPFSEFVQERIYDDHGLSDTGKFKDDFRLTDYGKLLRRYWLDEIPQIFDWFRGEIKLVGMRATSPHFLSLYPKELYGLYVQTKPGLIPPIFDASTSGFEDIVRIELEYLDAYQNRPISTDVRYFFKTFNDIVIRGVRSK